MSSDMFQLIKNDWKGASLEVTVGDAALAAIHDSLTAAVERAKGYAPVKTGALRDSIAETEDGFGSPLDYSLYQEIGFHDRGGTWHEGVHYLQRAADEELIGSAISGRARERLR